MRETCHIAIPNYAVGAIIGAAGANIKRIIRDSNAFVTVYAFISQTTCLLTALVFNGILERSFVRRKLKTQPGDERISKIRLAVLTHTGAG